MRKFLLLLMTLSIFLSFSACGGNSARLGGLRPPLPHIL